MERRGPGLLLGDIRDGKDADLLAARDAIQEIDADILLLTGVDTDYDGLTATALAAFINAGYDFTFTEIGNTGVPSGFDLDRDGRFGEPEDALSFGRFRGEGGMALLSRHPIDRSAVTSFTDMRWIDVPDTRIPRDYFTETEIKNLTVSSRGHWIAPVQIGDMRLNIMAFHATTPAFDGAEDRNGRRNADEVALWRHLLDGRVEQRPDAPFVLMGDANLDPLDGDGVKSEIRALLAHPALQDPEPRTARGGPAPNATHQGDPALDTADWRDPEPGNLRVDYILPSSALVVLDSGIEWVDGPPDDPFRHGLVWVDIAPVP